MTAQGNVTLNVTNAGHPLSDIQVYVFTTNGQYLNLNNRTDTQGQVVFTLPQGDYLFRANWLNNHYWSQELSVTADKNLISNLSTGGGTMTLTVRKDQENKLEGIKAYVFNEVGTYLGLQSVTDNMGQTSFTLGNGIYKIRLDYMGYQFWTEVFTIPNDSSLDHIIEHNQVTARLTTTCGDQVDPAIGTPLYLYAESGTYMGIQTSTNLDGHAEFSLPGKPYKLRADYLGGQYWSQTFTTMDPTINIAMGRALINVSQGETILSEIKVYVFDENNSYTGLNSLTNPQGIATFDLPEGNWKFRADYLSSQYWAESSILAHQDNTVGIDIEGGILDLTLEKYPGHPITGVKVYAFSSNGTYLHLNHVTSDTGGVSFQLPKGDYKFRADYLGYQFWTDLISIPITSSHTLTIPHQDVTFTIQGYYLDNFAIQDAKTYLFTESGIYQSLTQNTNANGQVVYFLPEKPYKLRADYLSVQYWSESVIQTDDNISIDHGKAVVTVMQSGDHVSGARVYLFTETGTYLGHSENTDATGNASFVVPVKKYKFRIDYNGSQYWSDPIDLIVNQEIPVNLNLDTLALNFTTNPYYKRYDGEMPIKKAPEILLASIGSLAGYLETGTPQPGVAYYINNHLGTPIKMINGEGQVIWDGSYRPFGSVMVNTEDVQNHFRFPGQYFDVETGLHYNGWRYYDPETGRYPTFDPIGLAGGINPYVYAESNPINYIDPDGLNALLANPAIGSGFGVGAAGMNNQATVSDYIQAGKFLKDTSFLHLQILAGLQASMVNNLTGEELSSCPVDYESRRRGRDPKIIQVDPKNWGPLAGAPGSPDWQPPSGDPHKDEDKYWKRPANWKQMTRWQKTKWWGVKIGGALANAGGVGI